MKLQAQRHSDHAERPIRRGNERWIRTDESLSHYQILVIDRLVKDVPLKMARASQCRSGEDDTVNWKPTKKLEISPKHHSIITYPQERSVQHYNVIQDLSVCNVER